MTLSWSASSGATSYNVEVRNASTGSVVATYSPTTTSQVASLSFQTPYRWTVKACNANGCSTATSSRYFQTPAPPMVETQTDYLSLSGKPIAEIKRVSGADTVTYLHADLLGSPRMATNASKATIWQEHFDPYGKKLN